MSAEDPFELYSSPQMARREPANLADILERVLDKGIVIAGDIRIDLLDIELLTVKLRLLIASADKAKEMGIDWWASDPHLSSKAADEDRRSLEARLDRLEELIGSLKAELPARAQASNGSTPATSVPSEVTS